MALKPNMEIYYSDITFFSQDENCERGVVVEGYYKDGFKIVQQPGFSLKHKPIGIILNDIVKIDLCEQAYRINGNIVPTGSKVDILVGYLTNVKKINGKKLKKIGVFNSELNEDGFIQVYISR